MKVRDIIEARYYGERDLVKCPACKGIGIESSYRSPTTGERQDILCRTCNGDKTITKRELVRPIIGY